MIGEAKRNSSSRAYGRFYVTLDKYFRENYDNAPFRSKNLIILVKYG
jgi:hypothetical protein